MASYLFAVRVLDAPRLGTFAVDAGFRLYIDFEGPTPTPWKRIVSSMVRRYVRLAAAGTSAATCTATGAALA